MGKYSHSYHRPEEVKYETNYDESAVSYEAADEPFELPIENTIVKGTHSNSDLSNSPEGKTDWINPFQDKELNEEIIEPKPTEEIEPQVDVEGFQTVDNIANKGKAKRKRK